MLLINAIWVTLIGRYYRSFNDLNAAGRAGMILRSGDLPDPWGSESPAQECEKQTGYADHDPGRGLGSGAREHDVVIREICVR